MQPIFALIASLLTPRLMFWADTTINRVGPVSNADGSNNQNRTAKTGELVVSQAHGKYFEASHRGVLFAACEQGSGVAPGTALGTTAALVLYNPQGSGKRLSIKKVAVGYISGTLGAGTLYHCINNSATQTAPSSGTALTPVASDVGNTATPVGQARAGATVGQPVAYRPFVTLSAELASTASPMQDLYEDIDGEIVLEPGTSYQLQSVAAAGSTPKITAGVTWDEITIV
jgi:hypothetical protein